MINETVLRDVLIVLAKQQKATSELISLLLTEVSSLGQSVNGVRAEERPDIAEDATVALSVQCDELIRRLTSGEVC